MQVTFDQSAKKFILDALETSISENGELVEKENPNQPILTMEGQELSENEFGGVIPGSTIFIQNDLPSIVRVSDVLISQDEHPR